MDLLLRCRFERDAQEVQAEFALSYEHFHTVGQLAAALGNYYFVPNGEGDNALVVWADRTGQRLRDEQTLREAGIVNGDSILLIPRSYERDPQIWQRLSKPPSSALSGVEVRVVAGPDSGLFQVMRPGQYDVGLDSGPNKIALTGAKIEPRHASLHVTPEHDVHVSDLGSRFGTYVNERPVDDRGMKVGPNDLIRVGTETTLALTAVSATAQTSDHLGQIPFNRTPYQQPLVKEKTFEKLPAVPKQPNNQKFMLAAALLPVIGGIVMAVAFGRLIFLVMVFLAPLVALGSWLENKYSGRKTFRQEKKEYLEKVERYLEKMDEAIEEEQQQRLRAAPALNTLVKRALFRQVQLWERGRDVADFMTVRLGVGRLRSKVEGGINSGGDEAEHDRILEEIELRKYVEGVPITVDLKVDPILGLFGDFQQVTEIGAALVSQVACLHSPEDVVIVAALSEDNARYFNWLKWLPHCRSAASPVEGRPIVIGPEEGRDLLVRLSQTMAARSTKDHQQRERPVHVVVLISEGAGIDPVAMSRTLDAVPGTSVSVIWLGAEEAALPRQCRSVLQCATTERSLVRFTDPEREAVLLISEGLAPAKARSVALFLAPLRDVTAAGGTAAMPSFVSLFQSEGITPVTAEQMRQRWAAGKGYHVNANLGQSANGPLEIDMVADGPHALVAGTSGAGKSELLQTMVASMALNHSPDRVNFLFIDYKGGAAFAPFEDLPHAVGFVTNLNEQLSNRALISLRAELKYRQLLLEGRAKDVEEFIKKFPDEPVPSLLIVVDEFATLVKEIPDFVAGIVDIAQRGRSLGIHLVLATQRPTGAVNENILANTNLRIALRVVDSSDSMNIINAPDAANIPQPLRGRAYARRGPAELTAFQSAYANAPIAGKIEARLDVAEFPVTGVVTRRAPAKAKGDVPEEETTTELIHTVGLAREVSNSDGYVVRKPWLEPLPEALLVDDCLERVPQAELERLAADPGRYAVLGLLDDPENQNQYPAVIDLESEGGLLIFGGGGAGKSTALRSMAAVAAMLGSPQHVDFMVMDFGGRTQSALASLPHCRGVVSSDDIEETTRMISFLQRSLDERRKELFELRAATYSEALAAGKRPSFARTVVYLDNMSGFASTFERIDNGDWIEGLQALIAAGRQVGIHFVITADRRNSIPNRIFSLISSRFVMRMADADEMATLGIPSKVAKSTEFVVGRGYLDMMEVQVPVVSSDAAGPEQAARLDEIGADMSRRTERAASLPRLPEVLEADLLPPSVGLTVPIGVADFTGDTISVDLDSAHFLIAGPSASGRSSAAALLALKLKASVPTLSLHVFGAASSPLKHLKVWSSTSFKRSGHVEALERLADDLETLMDVEYSDDVQAVIFVDETDDLSDYQAAEALSRLVRLDCVRFVAVTTPHGAAGAHSGWLRDVVRAKRSLFLAPEVRAEADVATGQRLKLRPGQEFPAGRGVLYDERTHRLVQIGRPRLTDELDQQPVSEQTNA